MAAVFIAAAEPGNNRHRTAFKLFEQRIGIEINRICIEPCARSFQANCGRVEHCRSYAGAVKLQAQQRG